MRYRVLVMGLCAVLLVAVAGSAVPGTALAQSDNTLTVRLWQGQTPQPGRYVIGQETSVVLTYFWYAATDAQLQDFLDHVAINIGYRDEMPLFSSQEAAAMWWQASEPFSLGGQSIRLVRWVCDLGPLTPGVHSFETTISLDAAVSDGIASAPFGPGVLVETTNVITVLGEGYTLPVGTVALSELSQTAALPAATPVPVYVAPTAAPYAASTVLPTVVYVAPTAAPPTAVPAEQWITRLQSHDGRVVGTLLSDAKAYWYPTEDRIVDPEVVFHAGQTLWVYGLDPTRQYYMVIIDEAYVWIHAGTIGPTNDATWAGKALPTVIIDPNS